MARVKASIHPQATIMFLRDYDFGYATYRKGERVVVAEFIADALVKGGVAELLGVSKSERVGSR